MAAGSWRPARNRRTAAAQLPFAICCVLALVTVLVGRAQASIFDEARAKITDWGAPMLAAVMAPVAEAQRWASGLSSFFSTYEENLALREENANLRRWEDRARELEQRVQRYELLLNAAPDPRLPSVAARVIGQSSRPFAKTMILDAGSERGVGKGQAVLDDRGLLGRVYVAGARTSWVILLTDPNSRVPVVIEPSNQRAIMAGDNSMSPLLQLDSSETPVRPGDRVYSTGDGGLLPPHIPVGAVRGDGEAWRVTLFADPDLGDYVHVVDYRPGLDPPAAGPEDVPVAAESAPGEAGSL